MKGNRNTQYWLSTVVYRAHILLFLFQLLVMFFFILGNFQEFLDNTQEILLHITKVVSLVFLFATLYSLAVQIVLRTRKIGLSIGRLVFTVLSLTIGLVIFLLVNLFLSWLQPVVPIVS